MAADGAVKSHWPEDVSRLHRRHAHVEAALEAGASDDDIEHDDVGAPGHEDIFHSTAPGQRGANGRQEENTSENR